MNQVPTFTVELEAVTPVFMGGVRQHGPAELRVPSLKGLLRYWYRAADPDYRQREPRIFGGAGQGQGQAPFLMVAPAVTGGFEWRPGDYRGFQNRVGDLWRNGATYLSFSLKGRRALAAGQRLTVIHYLSSRATSDPDVLKALCASWWLLAHVGGLGSRCRRGFGSVWLLRWQMAGAALPSETPPVPLRDTSPKDWWQDFEQGLRALRRWFTPPAGAADHLRLDAQARFLFVVQSSSTTWQEGLDKAGRLLQDFRQKGINYGPRDPRNGRDYRAVLSHVTAARRGGATPLSAAPERVAFGLPLRFFFRRTGAEATFRGIRHDRSASRLWLRVVRAGGSYHTLVCPDS